MTMHVHIQPKETHRIALPRRLVGRRFAIGQAVDHISGAHLGVVTECDTTAMGRELYTVEAPNGCVRHMLGHYIVAAQASPRIYDDWRAAIDVLDEIDERTRGDADSMEPQYDVIDNIHARSASIDAVDLTDVYLRVAGAITELDRGEPEFAEKLLRRALVGLARAAGIDPEKSRLKFYALVDEPPAATN
ncbi:hypothetical protein OIU34_27865 [Pararhizobium sp. BT-229]|uniref:hypothetical protein n=1 Tax=Pararhizobium sp. BT-229 TaxID=2986923 RepID=UPI0021F6BC1A|nr:hypothetical protein [Pararhizobium sp. BT-229]MCV9965695.1 hypothetical protein [Pararhizobium sp. BT-229]